MAIRFRKDRAAKPWMVYFRNPVTGKMESQSFASEAEAKKEDSLVKHRLKFERESFQKEDISSQCKADGVTLEFVYIEYIKHKNFTKKAIRWQMFCMRPILAKYGKTLITDITKQDVAAMIDADLQTNIKQATVRGRFSVFRAVMRWAVDRDYLESFQSPKIPQANYEKFVPPTPEEINAIMMAAAPHIQRVVLLGSQFGVRVGPSEMFQLTWADVDMVRRTLRVHGSKKNLNSPWREVPIREQLVPVFERWQKEDAQTGSEFLVNFRGKPITNFSNTWARTLKRAGITRRIRPYDLRHAFATEAIAAGVDIGTVAKLMGHSSPTMIFNHYQFVMDKQKRSAVEALPMAACMTKLYDQKISTYDYRS